jgi:hypothetical protein
LLTATTRRPILVRMTSRSQQTSWDAATVMAAFDSAVSNLDAPPSHTAAQPAAPPPRPCRLFLLPEPCGFCLPRFLPHAPSYWGGGTWGAWGRRGSRLGAVQVDVGEIGAVQVAVVCAQDRALPRRQCTVQILHHDRLQGLDRQQSCPEAARPGSIDGAKRTDLGWRCRSDSRRGGWRPDPVMGWRATPAADLPDRGGRWRCVVDPSVEAELGCRGGGQLQEHNIFSHFNRKEATVKACCAPRSELQSQDAVKVHEYTPGIVLFRWSTPLLPMVVGASGGAVAAEAKPDCVGRLRGRDVNVI